MNFPYTPPKISSTETSHIMVAVTQSKMHYDTVYTILKKKTQVNIKNHPLFSLVFSFSVFL
jgi:hypothetical protein